MLGSSWVAVQLAASQEGLSSMSEWVSEWHGVISQEIEFLNFFSAYVASTFHVLPLSCGKKKKKGERGVDHTYEINK
jgi:hypothetical protein